MRSLIQSLISFEIYLRAVSWVIIAWWAGKWLWNNLIYKKKRIGSLHTLFWWEGWSISNATTLSTESTLWSEQELSEYTWWNTLQDMLERSKETVDMTHKLLQHIEAETEESKEIINKIEAMEKEDHSEDTSWDKEESHYIDNEQKSNNDAYNVVTTETINNEPSVEIYNITTNHESINKKKFAYETIKHEIDNLKVRNLRVDYEKKLIEATTHFPDEKEFHAILGDWYIEREEYKKAQSLFKKLHTQDENDDKILYKLWVINLELQDFISAEYLLSRAHALKPDNPKYHQILAEIKYNLEKIDESIDLMEKAVDLRPWKFEYIEILGRLYKEVNNIHLYYKTLLKLNALDPLNSKVKAELSKFKQ